LARTPAPPMPASLAARLDAALAAEVTGLAGARSPGHAVPAEGAVAGRTAADGHPAPGPTAPGPTAPGPTGPRRDRPRRGAGTGPGHTGPGHTGPGRRDGRGRAASRLSLRLAAVTAAVVLLAGGGYAVARLVSPGSTGVSANSSGAAASRTAAGSQPELAP